MQGNKNHFRSTIDSQDKTGLPYSANTQGSGQEFIQNSSPP
jgi:hypothetical protein